MSLNNPWSAMHLRRSHNIAWAVQTDSVINLITLVCSGKKKNHVLFASRAASKKEKTRSCSRWKMVGGHVNMKGLLNDSWVDENMRGIYFARKKINKIHHLFSRSISFCRLHFSPPSSRASLLRHSPPNACIDGLPHQWKCMDDCPLIDFCHTASQHWEAVHWR